MAAYKPSTAFQDFADPGAPYYDAVQAADFPKAVLRFRNDRWAARVGLNDLSNEDWVAHFARFDPLPDNMPKPLALRYHGHQFRTYNHEIGDGRGFLFAQLYDDQDRLLDLSTKGSGQTPYSRFGDGRLTLKGGVREVLATEMLEALGVYTSKTFSLIETGEELHRGDEPSPARSSVMVRLGHSHVRFGTFQRLAMEGDTDAIAALSDYCVEHFDPDLKDLATNEKTAKFFERVLHRSARLASQWMAAGFVHGVLNTDNMNVTGESFDYGPWRFVPTMDPGFTAAYFDQTGLYAYGRQAEAVLWNLSRLGGAIVSAGEEDALNKVLQSYPPVFEAAMADAFFARLGLKRRPEKGDADFEIIAALMRWMQGTQIPFEQVFFDWFCGAASEDRRRQSSIAKSYDEPAFADVAAMLMELEPDKPERLAHVYFQRPTPSTMLIDEMEALWAPIAEDDDWSPLNSKIAAIREMGEAYGFVSSRYVEF